MSTYQILCLVGVPSLISTIIGIIVNRISAKRKKDGSLEKGIQALLRDRLYDTYNKWMDRGYAPIWVRENFQNMYEQYHKLGQNGVMDNLKDQFMDLPTEERRQ